MNIQLVSPETEADWLAYHRIRECVLWERRGLYGVYDPTHQDEYKETNHPMLLIHESKPVGVVRIDLDIDSQSAGFRRVAITLEQQGKGFGKELMKQSEEFALSHGCYKLHANVSPDAIGFYQMIGYHLKSDHPANDPQKPRMEKEITTNHVGTIAVNSPR